MLGDAERAPCLDALFVNVLRGDGLLGGVAVLGDAAVLDRAAAAMGGRKGRGGEGEVVRVKSMSGSLRSGLIWNCCAVDSMISLIDAVDSLTLALPCFSTSIPGVDITTLHPGGS